MSSRKDPAALFRRLVKKHFGDASSHKVPLSEPGLQKTVRSGRMRYNGGIETMPARDLAPTPVERLKYYYRGMEEKGIHPSRVPNTKLFNRYKGFKTAAMLQLFFEALGYKVEGTRGRTGCTMIVNGVRVAVLSRYKPTRPGRSSLAPAYLFQTNMRSVSEAELFLLWIEPLRELYVLPRNAVNTTRICINRDVAYATRTQCWYIQFRNRFDILLRVLDHKSIRSELTHANFESNRAYVEAHTQRLRV